MVSFLDDQRMTRGGGGMSELVENREHGVQQTEFLESVMSQGALIGDDGKKGIPKESFGFLTLCHVEAQIEQ